MARLPKTEGARAQLLNDQCNILVCGGWQLMHDLDALAGSEILAGVQAADAHDGTVRSMAWSQRFTGQGFRRVTRCSVGLVFLLLVWSRLSLRARMMSCGAVRGA